jgi:pyridoxamine 5'-phosphate oxidase
MTGLFGDMRRDYSLETLDIDTADPDPLRMLDQWLTRARELSVLEANAMVLATVDQHGHPAARTVLLKDLDDRGLVFFTNYESRKGRDIVANPLAALVFTWLPLERQVRIEGTVEKVTPEESDAYFASRPRGSQIGAVASPQSEPVPDRAWLEARFARLEAHDDTISRPDTWGGYRVVPRMIEFWQGRRNRLHDRLRYDLTAEGWHIIRLAP